MVSKNLWSGIKCFILGKVCCCITCQCRTLRSNCLKFSYMQLEKLEKIFCSGFVIAEVAQAHDGSLGIAHSFIDAIADVGVDAVKFQTHIASEESTLDEPWRVKFSYQDETRFNYWKRMEFTADQWAGLAEHAKKRKILFLSSPFSVKAVKILDRLDIPFWKIPSGEIGNMELMEAVWKTKKPVLFSTGLCTLAELDTVIEKTKKYGILFGIFQCTSEYPCSPEHWGLNMIREFKKRYDCLVGFSDHSGAPYAVMAAIALGATLIEVHVTFSHQIFGPDVQASVTFDELRELVKGVRKIKSAINSPVDKDKMAADKREVKNIFGRSWALKKDLPAGTILVREHVVLKKPGYGISVDSLSDILGKRLRVNKSSNYLIKRDDIE